MRFIDLNADLGELPSAHDAEILPYLSSCSVACGFHAGNPELMRQTIRLAINSGVEIGAHPSYHDREHFGRRTPPDYSAAQMERELLVQIETLREILEEEGGTLHHIKPHGALYNDLAAGAELSDAFARFIRAYDPDLKIYCLTDSQLLRACREHELIAVPEGFADRAYETANRLRSRSLDGAVLYDPAEVCAQALKLAQGKITLHNGNSQPIRVETICLHGDTLGAVELSRSIHETLTKNGIHIASPAGHGR